MIGEKLVKTAIVTGVTGQDGGYLAKLLLSKGYRVIGAYRRGATDTFVKLCEHGIIDQIEMIEFDLLEFTNICRIVIKYQPDEFYNLAAQSFVALSFEEPIYTTQADGIGVLYILEALRQFSPKTRLYQASTSEMFGLAQETPQRESTPFYPRSPYGCAKLLAHWLTVNYREAFNLYTCSGILFNHESPFRGKEFVTRKITTYFAKLAKNGANGVTPLELGNLDAKRDWGFAGDYVELMWKMLQQEEGDTYVISTGETHTVREFVIEAASYCGLEIEFSGSAENEVATDRITGRVLVRVNPKFYRPAEVHQLLGDSTRAREKLNWVPKVKFAELVKMMMEKDIEREGKEIL
ncbi:MAG: GDP-mannose 4,6-dehydratase [Rickettsiales bacterium]|jgi:GDPmannose 4,6-dehydratase|nr:GDP-mannose 4,6-dehydratase [Rickettsiales bacterium]